MEKLSTSLKGMATFGSKKIHLAVYGWIKELELLSDIPEKNNLNNFKHIDIEILREERE